GGQERGAEREHERLDPDAVAGGHLVDRREAEAERQRGPEAAAVQPDRLAHELADRARLGWERLRSGGRVQSADSSRAVASPRAASASSKRHRARSGSSTSLATARSSSAATPASSAARSTAKPSIASTSRPWSSRSVAATTRITAQPYPAPPRCR